MSDQRLIAPCQATILVIEDDVLLSDLLRMAIQLRLRPVELRMFNRGRPALDACRERKPDLVIVDLGLPDLDGRQVIRALRDICPATRIIVLTGQINASLPGELLTLGVSGYVDKGSSLEHTEAAVRRVLEGGLYFSVGSAPNAKSSVGHRATAKPSPNILSEREREIVRLVARGMVSKEIGAELKLSPRTIEKARARIAQKLDVRDLPSLIKWSVEHGLT